LVDSEDIETMGIDTVVPLLQGAPGRGIPREPRRIGLTDSRGAIPTAVEKEDEIRVRWRIESGAV